MIKYDWQYESGQRVFIVSELLEKAAQKLWPEISLKALFYPLNDPDLGDLGSDFPQRLAGMLKLPVATVAAKLIKNLPPTDPFIICIHHDFFNIKVPLNLSASFSQNIPKPAVSDFAIVVPYPSGEYSHWSFLRLYALALLHYRLLLAAGFQSALFVGDREVIKSGEKPSAAHWHKVLALDTVEKSPTQDRSINLFSFLKQSAFQTIFIWSFYEIWKRSQLVELRKSKDLILQFPRRSWLFGEGIGLLPNYIESLSQDHFIPLEFYLAGDLNFTELDLSASINAERANQIWYLSATITRIKKILDQISSSSHDQCLAKGIKLTEVIFPSNFKEAILRLDFLHWSLTVLSLRGEVWSFIKALFDVLDQINFLINEPDFRHRIVSGTGALPEIALLLKAHEILATLSFKLNLCLPAQVSPEKVLK